MEWNSVHQYGGPPAQSFSLLYAFVHVVLWYNATTAVHPTASVPIILKLEGCIDDERQFKTAKRPHAPDDATVSETDFPR